MYENPGLRLELKPGVVVDFDNYVGTLDRGNGLREAAEEALAGVQADLRHLVEHVGLGSPLEWKVAKPLIRERFWAITALIDIHSHKRAKETLLRISDGAPLTICMGDPCRIRHGQREGVQTTAGYLRFSVQGCRAIFAEDRRTSGEMWAGLCPRCRGKSRRNQGRALNRLVNNMRRGHGARIYTGCASDELQRLETSGELANLLERIPR